MAMSGTVPTVIGTLVESTDKISVEIISDRQMFFGMAKQWNNLLEQSGNTLPFLSHDWLYTWWLWFGENTLQKTSRKLSIICIHHDNTLTAIAPFYIESKHSGLIGSKKTLRLLGQVDVDINIPECEQLDIIFAGGLTEKSLIITALNAQLKKLKSYSNLVFKNITKESLLYQLIDQRPWSQTSGLGIVKEAFSLTLPTSLDAFISTQNQRWRMNYRGGVKKVKVMGKTEIRLHKDPHEIHSGLQSLTQLLCSQQRKELGGKCSFDAEQYMRFHEDICHLFSLKSRVEIFSLVMEGRLLASLCYYKADDSSIQVYQMASIRGEGVRFSPLVILMTHVVEHLIKHGFSRVDFLSSCNCSDLGESCIKGKSSELYTLGWHKNWGRAYFYKSAATLYRGLQAN